jgi:hypothetical protein
MAVALLNEHMESITWGENRAKASNAARRGMGLDEKGVQARVDTDASLIFCNLFSLQRKLISLIERRM